MLKDVMLIILIIILSVAAGFFNASASVIQRYEAGTPEPKELFRRNFSKNLSRNRKWIFGFGLEGIAFVCQAAALRKGALVLVAPLMTVDLVFLMLILHYAKGVPTGKREWAAIAMICLGLSGMLISADPTAGQKPYVLSRLVLVCSVTALIISIGIYIVRRNSSSSVRAAVSAIAAGFSFSLIAVFTKIVTRQLTYGFGFVLTHWQVWALLVSGIVAIIMTQNTYGAGPVAVSQPIMEIVEAMVSITLGIYLFGDVVKLGAINLLFATMTAVIAGTGIAILGRSKRLQIHEY